ATLKKREPGDTTPPATDDEKEAAFVKLAGAYSSTLRKHRREHRSLYEYLGEEEAQELALLGVIRAAQKATEPYLSGVILDAIAEMFAEHSTTEVYVPPQMIRRFRRIMDRAGNDPEVGLEICETPIGNDSAMSRETFQQIYDALLVDGLFESADDAEAYGPGSHMIGDDAMPLWGDPSDDAEEAEQTVREAHIALDAMCEDPVVESPEGGFGPSERELVEIKFHFQDDFLSSLEAPNTRHLGLSDDFLRQEVSLRYLGAEAVAAGDSIISRQKVQRVVQAALAKGREAILAARAAEEAE